VRALFSQFGRVFEVNLFRAFQGASTTKGCGLVTMGTNDEAVAAIEALDQKFTWEGMDAPMVVKWMDAALQKRRREEHLAAMRQGLAPSMAGMDPWCSSSGSSQPSSVAAMSGLGGLASGGSAGLRALSGSSSGYGEAPSLSMGGVTLESGAQLVLPAEVPPPGCAPDAYKLFIGNGERSGAVDYASRDGLLFCCLSPSSLSPTSHQPTKPQPRQPTNRHSAQELLRGGPPPPV